MAVQDTRGTANKRMQRQYHVLMVFQTSISTGLQFFQVLDELSQRCEAIFVSFDIDAIKSSDCPVCLSSRLPYAQLKALL